MGSVQEQQASQEWCINGMADPADKVPWFWLYADKIAKFDISSVWNSSLNLTAAGIPDDSNLDSAADEAAMDEHTYCRHVLLRPCWQRDSAGTCLAVIRPWLCHA